MNNDFKLLEPTDELIEQYNALWKTDTPGTTDIYLYEGVKCPVGKLSMKNKEINDFSTYEEIDNKIKGYLENNDFYNFFYHINGSYHTRITNIKQLSKNLSEKYKTVDDFKDVSDFVIDTKEKGGRYEYSFATKVFSFIDNSNPIMDSFVSTLLWEYLKNTTYSGKKGDWGSYENYKNAYEFFKKEYGLTKTNKEIDVFLWTYAVCLDRYWKKVLGVLSFESVQFSVK